MKKSDGGWTRLDFDTSYERPFRQCDFCETKEYDGETGTYKHQMWEHDGGIYCQRCKESEEG